MVTTGLNMPGASSSPSICKLHLSSASIAPSYLDPSQPPTKRVPFRQIHNVPYVREVQLCMPQWTHRQLIGGMINAKPHSIVYHKVLMSLKDVLQDYELRTGNYIMLAEQFPPSIAGLSANSTTMNLNRGQLSIEMPYEIHQRSGLGACFRASQVAGGGRKHDKRSIRYKVDIDLRQPRMVKGKNSFDKLMWASREVEGLREARLWLVTELEGSTKDGKKNAKKRKRDDVSELQPGPHAPEVTLASSDFVREAPEQDFLAAHHPTTITEQGTTHIQQHVLIPSFLSSARNLDNQLRPSNREPRDTSMLLEDDIHEMTEYLSLLFAQSPRITKQEYGRIDSYLCQYTLPSIGSVDREPVEEDIQTSSWSGLISSEFVTNLVVDLIRASRRRMADGADATRNPWAAIQVNAHSTDAVGGIEGYLILLQSGEADEDVMIDEDEGNDTKTRSLTGAFTHATCFEFVKSVV